MLKAFIITREEKIKLHSTTGVSAHLDTMGLKGRVAVKNPLLRKTEIDKTITEDFFEKLKEYTQKRREAVIMAK